MARSNQSSPRCCSRSCGAHSGYANVREQITAQESHHFGALLEQNAIIAEDPSASPSVRSPDLGDDYLPAVAASTKAMLVTHDQHLLSLRERHPICIPEEFLELLRAPRATPPHTS